MWRALRTILLLAVGAVGGFAGAAAMLRVWMPSRGDATSEELELVAIFDGIDLASESRVFRGGRILAWFGGVSLDLRDVTLAPGAVLDVRALFGGVSVRVPPGCRVDATATTTIGGAVDVSVPEPDDPDAPTLVVRAATTLGGISIGT
jgi:hypothetical protein